MSILAIDLGKTGCRALLQRPDGSRTLSEADGARGLADPAGLSAASDTIHDAARQLVDPGAVDVVVVGAAGLGRTAPDAGPAGERAEGLLDALARTFPRAELTVASDMTMSHAGALGGRSGVVLAVGTGTVALSIASDGAFDVIDGWGYLLGDHGSGYALGRAGLDAALRHHDGRGGSAVLAAAAGEHFGDLDALPGRVHGHANPPAVIASFATEVLGAARVGDPAAVRIREQAVGELVSTARAAIETCRDPGAAVPVDLALLGGVFGDPEFRASFGTALAAAEPFAAIREPEGNALEGALLLATGRGLPHEPLLRRRAAPA